MACDFIFCHEYDFIHPVLTSNTWKIKSFITQCTAKYQLQCESLTLVKATKKKRFASLEKHHLIWFDGCFYRRIVHKKWFLKFRKNPMSNWQERENKAKSPYGTWQNHKVNRNERHCGLKNHGNPLSLLKIAYRYRLYMKWRIQ